ncbi:translocation/assembly module TamB domain-containing protein [Geothrix mesophila]|uniref:translocation/assembly module TamB domain-containing protein n=1 Tax=Geothrix mesophila TaxID=2922723 RepID=UPI001FAB67E5|nr:translocation/assembly module TamB domain-containing protein [Geothrix sp. SG198]
MVWHPTKEAVQRLWGRRWVRRISYLLVAGAATVTIVPWVATRPVVLRWAISKLDGLVREETGLSLEVGQLELHPLFGSASMRDVRLGGDLLTVQRVEVQTNLTSLLAPTHRIFSIRVEHPHLRLTEAGLAAIHLKEHPPRKGPLPQVRLDLLSITGGEIDIPEPLRGLPPMQYRFEVKATGTAPNQLRVDVAGPQWMVKGPNGWEKGRLDLNGEVTEQFVVLKEGYFRLGESQIRLHGRFDAKKPGSPERLDARATGVMALAQAAHWGGMKRPPLTGDLDLNVSARGTFSDLRWTVSADGAGLRPSEGALAPGNLDLRGSGNLEGFQLSHLRWQSSQGDLSLEGGWSRKKPAKGTLTGQGLDLEVLGRLLRLPELQGLRGNLKAQAEGPADPEALRRPDRWQGTVQLGLTQHGLEAGNLHAALRNGQATLDQLHLDLEALKVDGTGWAQLGPRSLARVEAEGTVDVGAGQVAQALRAWKVVDLDMEGQTRAKAKVRWSRGTGLELDGSGEVAHPRWHGARADSVEAQVQIRDTELRVTDIDLKKDEGRGGGDLWLTWGRTAPGQKQMDMCYTAFRLPVAEGLRAADVKDTDGRELPITGLGGGWVRLQGQFDHITMNGSAQVESGEVYGIKIPAASSDFSMDIDRLRLRLDDVRIGERLDLLGGLSAEPEGALALAGKADMDFKRWTWWVDLAGRLDSQLLNLPGPRVQAQVESRLLGPITSPFGSLDLPEGRVTVSRGRMFFGGRSLEGLEASVKLERGHLEGRLGIEGMARPVVEAQVRRDGLDLAGHLALTIAPDSARTDTLARSLTEDLLEDLNLEATADGRWDGRALAWTGTLNRLAAQFNVFELHQAQPSALHGDAAGAVVDISLEGGARKPADASQAQAAGLRLSGTLPFSMATPLGLRVQGGANLAHLKTIFDRVMEVDEYSLLSEVRIQGTSRFDLLVHGTYGDPLLDGHLALEKGRLNLRGYQGVEDLQAEVMFKDHTISIPAEKPLQGTLAHGDLKVSGGVTWKLGGLDTYALKASLANFQLRDVPEGLEIQGTLRATLDGNEDGGVLKGRLRADRLNYQTEVKLADLILRSALSDSGGLTGLDLDDPLDRIRLDLDLDLRNPWSFNTNLLKLDGRTEGPFQVVGTLAHPIPKGILVFQPGGRVTNIFPAGDMVVDRGSLTFSELRPLDPVISLQGSVTSIPGYTVNLDIHGTLSNLAIVPSSTPSLRQDEIVAILINPGNAANVGTASASSGATQGAITSGLASAGSGLISTLAFAPFQEQLRRTLGLDRVNVAVRTTSLGTTETEVTMGKSINLFGQRSAFVVSHKKSGNLSITSGQVEWRFGNFILQLGASKGGGAGLTPSGEIRHSWSPN